MATKFGVELRRLGITLCPVNPAGSSSGGESSNPMAAADPTPPVPNTRALTPRRSELELATARVLVPLSKAVLELGTTLTTSATTCSAPRNEAPTPPPPKPRLPPRG